MNPYFILGFEMKISNNSENGQPLKNIQKFIFGILKIRYNYTFEAKFKILVKFYLRS